MSIDLTSFYFFFRSNVEKIKKKQYFCYLAFGNYWHSSIRKDQIRGQIAKVELGLKCICRLIIVSGCCSMWLFPHTQLATHSRQGNTFNSLELLILFWFSVLLFCFFLVLYIFARVSYC